MTVTINGTTGVTSPGVSVSGSTVLGTMGSSVITSGTAVATTSGTTVDFTSIPSWVKRITVMLSGVSTNGATGVFMRLGTSSGFESTGYTWYYSTNGASGTGNTTYFQPGFRNTAASTFYGTVVLCLLNSSTNLWVIQQSTTAVESADVYTVVGSKALAATLTQLRLGSVDGTSTFDLGSINILYE